MTKLYKYYRELFKEVLEDYMRTDLDALTLSDCGVEDNRYEVARAAANHMAVKSRGADFFEDRLLEEESLIYVCANEAQGLGY